MGVTALRHKDATCPFYLTVTMCRGECNQCLFMYQCMSEIGCVFCNCTQECVCVCSLCVGERNERRVLTLCTNL